MSYQFTPDKYMKRSGSPINDINIKKSKRELEITKVDMFKIFTSNNFKYNNINDINKPLLNRMNYLNNNHLMIFEDYCKENNISDNIISISKTISFYANHVLNTEEYENLNNETKETIVLASLFSYLFINTDYKIFKMFDNNKLFHKLLNYIILDEENKEIDSWKLLPKYALISMNVGMVNLYEIVNNHDTNNLEIIRMYNKKISNFKNNFKNEYLYNLYTIRLNEFNEIYNYINNNSNFIDKKYLDDFYY